MTEIHGGLEKGDVGGGERKEISVKNFSKLEEAPYPIRNDAKNCRKFAMCYRFSLLLGNVHIDKKSVDLENQKNVINVRVCHAPSRFLRMLLVCSPCDFSNA